MKPGAVHRSYGRGKLRKTSARRSSDEVYVTSHFLKWGSLPPDEVGRREKEGKKERIITNHYYSINIATSARYRFYNSCYCELAKTKMSVIWADNPQEPPNHGRASFCLQNTQSS